MAGLSVERPGWQVQIRRSRDAAPVGAGVLVTDNHVLTCAHVVSHGAARPTDPVFVEFQFAARHEPILASVVEGGWWPQGPDGSGDVAVLALSGDLPAGANPAPLREAEAVAEHSFRAYGYPRGHERNGVWSHGVVVGPAEVEWIQLEAAGAEGFSLLQGFSGSPVWDEELGAVVGIVVSTDREVDVRTGYAIPIEVVRRYWADIGQWVGWRLSHDPAMASHWEPRARGVDRDSRPGWYFTGRRRAMRELVAWVEHEEPDGAVRVVTSGPGSGKSAVLARLVGLADPAFRARIEAEDPAQLEDPALVPSVGRVSVAVLAAGLDLGQATGRIAAAVSMVTEDPNALITQVRQRGQPLVVVLDALDEAIASEARAIATKLLVPLARDAGAKVVVGTRPGPEAMFLRSFGGRAHIIDLDDPRYFEMADLAEYAARSLRLDFDPASFSPYRDDAKATAVVAAAIAEAAYPSFLVAGLTARARAEDPQVIDYTVAGWEDRAAFPADVDMAMADYLDRLGDPERAFDLLVPVAYARYPGLPKDTLWAPLAKAYSGKPYGPADLDWLFATAGSFLLEETDDDGTGVVRLFHQALVDHIRSRTDPSLVEQAITGVLTERAEAAGGWLDADHYSRLHAASHAARAGEGLLDRLVVDPAFLVAADRRGLLRTFPRLTDPEARRSADSYRAAAGHRSGDEGADAAYLELASRMQRNDALADAIRELGLAQPFITTFGRRRPTDDPLSRAGHAGRIPAVAFGMLDGAPVMASGGDDETVRLWDPATGTPRCVLRGQTGAVWAIAGGILDGAPVLASAGADGTLRLWDPVEGIRLRFLEGHTGGVRAVAWGSLGGLTVLTSAGDDGTVRVWDPSEGIQLRVLEGHTGWVRGLAWGSLDGAPVLASGGGDGTVRLWDPAEGAELRVLRGHTAPVWAVVWGSLDGVPVVASAGDDGTVRLWDPSDGTQIRVLDSHTGWVRVLAWSRGEGAPMLASAGFDGTVRLWDPTDGRQLRVLEGHMGWVWSVAWGMLDGAAVLISSGDDATVRIWDSTDGRQLRVLEGRASGMWVGAWGTLDGAPVLASGSADGTVRLWDPTDGRQLRVLEGHMGWVWSVAWGTLDGEPMLASAGLDATVRLWDPTDGRQLRVLEGHIGAVWALAWGSLDGTPILASASRDATVRLWDPTDGRQFRVLEGHSGGVWALAWGSLDGEPVLASAGLDGTIRLWDPTDRRQLRVLEGHSGGVWALAWGSLDGEPVLASAGDDATLRLWDPRRPRVAVINLGIAAHTVSFNPGGWVAIAGWEGLAVLVIRAQLFADPQTARRESLPELRLQQRSATGVPVLAAMA